jgi:putative transposase
MARKARQKTKDAIFHIMSKSISEVKLFKDDEDKEKYLLLIKKYKTIYKVKIYGYCLMNNHTHLLVNANGADISKVMHGINLSYVIYYNKKYMREGHLFKDRFMSKIVDNEKYLKTVSLYIHNNPTAIVEFKECPEKYAFSSLGIYIGKTRDHFNIVDYDFIMSFFGKNLKAARKKYYNKVFKCNEEKLKEEIEFKNEQTDYKSQRKIIIRESKPEDIIEFVSSKMNIQKVMIHMKYSRNIVEAKALIVVMMRSLCNFKSSDICNILGNITQSRVSNLSKIGIELIGAGSKYTSIIEEFIKCKIC